MKHRTKAIGLGLALAALVGLLVLQVAVQQLQKAAYPRKYADMVQRYAQEYSLEEAYVYAVIRTESGFDPRAESDAGARGLMQMTQETFQWLQQKMALQEGLAFEALYEPQTSIRFGTYYLALCMQRYGQDRATAAAAYHSGMGKVDELLQNPEYSSDGTVLHTFPFAQMQNYVLKVERNYRVYVALWADDA